MKKELVIIIHDGVVYQIDVATPDYKVVKRKHGVLVRGTIFITYQTDELINYLGDDTPLAEIFDLECIDTQIRLSLGLERPKKWTVPNMIHTYLGVEEKTYHIEEYEDVLAQIASCYREMKEKGEKEWKRIEKIEIPVNHILYGSQKAGIYVNHNEIKPLCEQLHKELYELKNRVQLELGFVGYDLETYLDKKGIKHNKLTQSEIDKQIRLHPELSVFNKIRRAEQNFDCLVILDSIPENSDRCKPLFKGFGTSTGRITLRSPALQNINSKYRRILKDNNLPSHRRYVYIDYGQFEAGVLAGLTANAKLKELYEKDSVYEEIVNRTQLNREEAKKCFYCFVYGGFAWENAEPFYNSCGLQESIDKVINEAREKGFIETALGNRRCIMPDDDGNWILNHYIQGTSSLIFKQALIDVYSVYRGKVDLILPMHDAALYVVDNDVDEQCLIQLFVRAFQKWIPGIKPIVKVKEFFGDNNTI